MKNCSLVQGYNTIAVFEGKAIMAEHFDKNAPASYGVWDLSNKEEISNGTYYKSLTEAEQEFALRAFSRLSELGFDGKTQSDGELKRKKYFEALDEAQKCLLVMGGKDG